MQKQDSPRVLVPPPVLVLVTLIAGLAFAHAGQARVRKTADPVGKHRVAAVFFILAFIAIAASIPWPGTPNARPLWRW